MAQTSFYSKEELKQIGFKSLGDDVLISRYARIYTPEKISIGNKVRIDDFCVLSGIIEFHNYIHVAAACVLVGGDEGIVFEDYTGISSRSAIYAASDDYSGMYFTNPMIPEEYRHVISGKVLIKKHAIIGSGCTLLPGVVLGEGVAVGSMSLVNKSLEQWGVCIGTPCKRIKDREKGVLELENTFCNSQR